LTLANIPRSAAASQITFISHERKQVVIQFLIILTEQKTGKLYKTTPNSFSSVSLI